MLNRREFLNTTAKHAGLVSLAQFAPSFVARTAQGAAAAADATVLVLLFLNGGNDGINTVVPFKDEGYEKHRRELRLSPKQLIRLNDDLALHPSMRSMAKLWETDRLAIVQGVGYPNPSQSHFKGSTIWHTANVNVDPQQSHEGWIGKAFDEPRSKDRSVDSVYVGQGETPLALRGKSSVAMSLTRPNEFTLNPSAPDVMRVADGDNSLTSFVQQMANDARATAKQLALSEINRGPKVTYPASALGSQMAIMARLLKAGHGARVYFATHGSFDHHANQLIYHGNLLAELSDALLAFLDDLSVAGMADRVVVTVFSEFGRRVAENASFGTDHGTAGPVFVAGTRVRSGIFGETPRLTELDDGNLKWKMDFRRVYATVLEKWLDIPSPKALGAGFEMLQLFPT